MSLSPGARSASAVSRAGLGLLLLFPNAAQAQTSAANAAPAQPAAAGAAQSGPVSPGDCAAFQRYVLDQARAHKDAKGENAHSGTWLSSTFRFIQAGCRAEDAQGRIQIITMTDRDVVSFDTALTRMGRFDILGASGVDHCYRPDGDVCPPRRTGTIAPRAGAGGG